MSGFVAENMAAGVPGDNSFWVDADAKVRQLRGEVVASMKKAQLRSEDPRAREAAEADLKRELVEVKTTIAQAQEKYERARMHFRTLAQNQRSAMRRHEGVAAAESLGEVKAAETMEKMAGERADALAEYSKVLTVASPKATLYLTATQRALRERMPEQEREIMDTEAGRLTRGASVESAVKLMPADPRDWNPETNRDSGQTAQFVKASLALDELDRRTPQTHTRTVRGGALATECHQALTQDQTVTSSSWTRMSLSARATVDDERGLNSGAAQSHAARLGIPDLPAVSVADSSGGFDIGPQQKSMAMQAASVKSTGAVPIYSPNAVAPEPGPDTGLNR